jgi:type I restriction enzyme S subunit
MVPEGWDLVEAKDVCERISVGIVVKPKDYYVPVGEGTKAFRSANVREGYVEDSNWVYISDEGHLKNKKSTLRTGDVLVVRTGYPGTACVVPEAYDGTNCIDIIFARPDTNQILSEYLCDFTNSEYGKKQVLDGQGGLAQQHFNVGAFNQLRVPLPPLPEQRKIADILSTWDRAIEVTEALLATARTQKRALMQSLLTGKRRFPEFEGLDWKEVRLGDVVAGKKTKGKIVPTNEDGDGLPYIGATSFDGTFTAFTDSADAVVCHPEDLLVLWDGENAGAVTVGLHGVVSSTVVRFRFDRRQVLASFVRALLEHRNYEVRAVREGSGIPHMPKDFESWFQFALPSLAEQQAIMAAIDASGTDVGSIRQQLAKLRAEKKALMQQLLTGKRRVMV